MAAQWKASTWEAFLADTGMSENIGSDTENEVLIADTAGYERFSADESLSSLLSDIESFPRVAKSLKKAISKLSPRQKELVGLYYWEGLSQMQIAATLGITQQTVSIQLVRAIQRLRIEIFLGIKSDSPAPEKSQSEHSVCMQIG